MNYNTISYMDSLDLSDISDYEDYMLTSSDEEIPGMEDVLYYHRTLVCLNIYFNLMFNYNIIYVSELSLKEQSKESKREGNVRSRNNLEYRTTLAAGS